jgi:hypothetical protein
MSQARRLTVPRVICASACAGALALTGCGGGSSFTSQANSICKTYNAKIKALPQPNTPADLAKFFDQFVPLAQQGTSKLMALKPPSDKASQYQSYLALLQRELALTQQAAAAAHAGNTKQAVALAQAAGTLSSQAKALAKQLGMTDCGAK